MGENLKKTFAALEADIMCEIKDIVYPLESRLIFHNHDGYEMTLLLNGELALYNEGDGAVLKRGDIVLLDEFEFHRAQLLSNDTYDRIVINFKKPKIKELSTEKTDLLKCFRLRDGSKINVIHFEEEDIEKYADIAVRLRDALGDKKFGADILADAALTELLVLVNRVGTRTDTPAYEGILPEVVAKAFNYIEAHIADDLSLSTIEKELKYNGTYISRCFKQTLGISLQKYIIAKRISVAQKMLKEGDTAYNVCFLAGFSNYSNFSRTFRQHIGMSPREYRDEVYKIK